MGHGHSMYFKEMSNVKIIPGSGDMAQVEYYLPCVLKALGLIPSTSCSRCGDVQL